MGKHLIRLTSNGKMTLPVHIRRQLGLQRGDDLTVIVEGDEIRLRKAQPIRPLSDADPIWKLVGAGASGHSSTSIDHDRALADAEQARWSKS